MVARAEPREPDPGRHTRSARQSLPLRPTAVAVAIVLALVGTHSLRSFRDPSPNLLDQRITAGPLAGLVTDDLLENCDLTTVVAGSVGPDEGVLFYGAPAGYTYSRAAMDTNIVWLADFGAANATTVQWLTDHDRWPDVVIINEHLIDRNGGWRALVAEDPFIATIDAEYGEAVLSGRYVVLRQDGTTPDLPVGVCPALEP